MSQKADTILRGTENEADAIVMLTGKHAAFSLCVVEYTLSLT